MPPDNPTPSHSDKNISISGDVNGVVIAGDNNTVSQTIIQKFFNIFKSESETLEQRNRRILLNHVENAWIKGVLDASLYGAAMLDLGIKETPEAITNQYPWTLKKESTDETLPAGTSMLEIFDSIGMGRSLLILGAPGSGKTTMLLELARGLIARAREDVTQPIPMVFNLASWTEKLTLSDWLAQELNNLYSVPRKTTPDWVKDNKLLLLLDGLDEVRQESRAKCVEAINEFRKQNGLTSLAVCSRSQDYADLKAKLSFEGAIEVQPLTQRQIAEFFNHFGDEMAGIKQALEKDSGLREMAETPLFLSIMILAYRDKQDIDILASKDMNAQRNHLFNSYIERMFERPRLGNDRLKKQDVLRWLSWLGQKMIEHKKALYLLEDMQPDWAGKRYSKIQMVDSFVFIWKKSIAGLLYGLMAMLLVGIYGMSEILLPWFLLGSIIGLIGGVIFGLMYGSIGGLIGGLIFGLMYGLFCAFFLGVDLILIVGQVGRLEYPAQRLFGTVKMFLFTFFLFGASGGIISGLIFGLFFGLSGGFIGGLIIGFSYGLVSGLFYGGLAIIRHYILRFTLAFNNLLPWRLVPFLDHCVDLIFLRRVGGGYIFIHRLLMEHFAEMYMETTK